MLSFSETTCRLTVIPLFLAFLLAVNKVLQSCARNLRAPALNCAQDDRCNNVLSTNHYSLITKKDSQWQYSGPYRGGVAEF